MQYGPLAVDGLTFDGFQGYRNSVPLIQISDNNPTGAAVSYFRGVRVVHRRDKGRRSLVNIGGGTRTPPKTPRGVPIFLLDHYGPGRHAKVVSTRAPDLLNDGIDLRARGLFDKRRLVDHSRDRFLGHIRQAGNVVDGRAATAHTLGGRYRIEGTGNRDRREQSDCRGRRRGHTAGRHVAQRSSSQAAREQRWTHAHSRVAARQPGHAVERLAE